MPPKEENNEETEVKSEKECKYRGNCPFQNGYCGPKCENYSEGD